LIRGILHVDLDAFFVSVEQVHNPALRGKPVIVGGNPDRRGVVAAASYEARAFGIHSAMSLAKARQLCPHAIFLPGNFANYRKASEQFMAILADFSPCLEPAGLDEAYLDISGCDIFGSPHQIALSIKERVKKELSLVASIGIASCKIVAKIASDHGKPDGLVEIAPGNEQEFLSPLPIGKLPGVGPRTEQKLKELGITTIGKLAKIPSSSVKLLLGASGMLLYQHAHGIDSRKVESRGETKSISRETTFSQDLPDQRILQATLRYLSERVGAQLRLQNAQAKTISLKLRYENFDTINRSHSSTEATSTDDTIYSIAARLFDKSFDRKKLVRLIGVEVSNLTSNARQLSMFNQKSLRQEKLDKAIDHIRKKYGFDSIQTGNMLVLKEMAESDKKN